ncbi:serine/threonine protein phosphatase [Acidianus sulfidivorans JP7]|uniref:Serine/threonine protein phosphatase n=1 Tax=Acidianus sulfidivorans JP7 TaxID=619593 RepID=A0A2U9IN20_9CREN|nr:metallophosphoesterase [Acidianus sulfidivorans]AWR97406.1 serine/threonine protein phosphatase [Acidianus sulfidivorans JP7]
MRWNGDQIKQVIDTINKAHDYFLSLPLLIELPETDSVMFVGDTHGAIDVTQEVFNKYYDKVDKIIFLGDYVDRGTESLENILFIINKMLENPEKVYMIRGNHESPITNEFYGFKAEINEKLGEEYYEDFVRMFSVMPYAITINGYFCVHGGIARNLTDIKQINSLPRPDVIPDNEIAFEILWNDPREELEGFIPNVRGEGTYFYGKDVTLKFLESNNLKGIIRGHEAVDAFRFELDNRVITVFSSRYHGYGAGALILNKGTMEKVLL